ncbi:MAG TPA: MXAN_5187 C-terminal domain-containing protein [Candidatus Acidoferrales bacterium]|nr:MXAN_5187 C-terminal domain-containing protein [Candidatus Acidoferrales bacterium]
MPTSQTDEDLSRLERDIRQLKIEFDQFFGGGRKRPPSDIEWRIEQVIKRYGDRAAEMNYGQRFRYGNLTQTYSKYREIFHKRMQRREEGKVDRHYGAAAREIEAERAKARRAARPQAVAVTSSDLEHEKNKVDELYCAFCEALSNSGESVDKLSREKFEQFLLQKSEQIRKQQGQEIEFLVSVENGKARLKARVKS